MRKLIRPLIAVTVAVGAILAMAGIAAAHVTVNPSTASQGGFAKLTFRVPNEKDNADTTSLDIQLPLDHPIGSVSVQPQPGWTYTVTKSKLPTPIKTDDGEVTEAVSQITWTGGVIKPGEFNEFNISAGPLPSGVTSLQFKALQTYSDGDIVRWIEDGQPGQAAPEHPAPVLTLTAAAASNSTAATIPTATPTSTAKSSDGTARALGVVGIVLGALALVGTVLVLARRSGSGQPPAGSAPSGRQAQSVRT
jgi:uncharacterized protein YcnI